MRHGKPRIGSGQARAQGQSAKDVSEPVTASARRRTVSRYWRGDNWL
jgi:hypothetical protein